MLLVAALMSAVPSPSQVHAAVPTAVALQAADLLVTFRWIGDREHGAAIRAEATPFELFETDVPPGFEVHNGGTARACAPTYATETGHRSRSTSGST